MSFESTACFAPTLSWKSRDAAYGSKCGPSYGPDASVPKFERKVGIDAHVPSRRRTRTSTPVGVRGRDNSPRTDYQKWCAFWKSTPVTDPEDPAPDLSSTAALPKVLEVDEEERQMRHDVHEDNRWALQHNNTKPEKLLRWYQGRNLSKTIGAAATPCRSTQPQDVWKPDSNSDQTLMRNVNWCNLDRPRRLEPCESPQRVWTPRRRPKTPAPIEIRQRGTSSRMTLNVPAKCERDPNNPRDVNYMKLQAFGFQDPKHTFPVQDEKKSREYERFSDFWEDRMTHQRASFPPTDKFLQPVTTQMEIGWGANDPEVYKPIGGESPSKVDLRNGLPRISLAGGTPGRLCSPHSKFVDNVLMTRPDFAF